MNPFCSVKFRVSEKFFKNSLAGYA